jgi:hypothetical protein
MSPNQATKRPFSALVLIPTLAIALCLGACGIFVEKPTPSFVEPRAAVPRDFLFSWHKPYNEWMDAPVRVYYSKVPLDQVLANPPFTRFKYYVVEKPDTMPIVTIDSLGISRRQLLWSMAHDYNLHMSLKTLPDGHPSEVLIRYRGDGGSNIHQGR